LYLIASQESTGGRVLEASARVLAAVRDLGIDPTRVALQLREKTLEARALMTLASPLRELTAQVGVRLFINDRIDVALAVGADGVHLGGHSLDLQEATRVAPHLDLALSTHHPEELALARQWRDEGLGPRLAFAVFGPVFDTPSKRAFGPAQGIEKLRAAVAAADDLPVLALGGIAGTPEILGQKVAAVRDAGAAGVACIRAAWTTEDPKTTLAALLGL